MTEAPHCVHHDTALGIALCVACGDVLCGACATRVQGRNLCASCLAEELAGEPTIAGATAMVSAFVFGGVALGGVVVLGLLTGLGLALHALG